MNLQSIVITNCIGIFLSLLVINSSHMVRKGKNLDSWLLTALLIGSCCCCLMEMLSFLVDGHATTFCKVVSWISNTWIYMANPLVSTLWLLYTDYHLHRKAKRLTTTYRMHLILLAASLIVILGNIFGQYLFTIDDQNVYARRPASYSIYVVTVIMLGSSIIEVIRYRKRHRTAIFFPIWMFLTPVFIGMAIQTLIYGISLGWCCTAIGLTALYMSMQNELAFRDSLTGLYNRQYLSRILNSWTGHSGIMIDMDYFKEINDRFGHSVGDQALRETAGILLEICPENSVVIRFAGDEFILLLTARQEIVIQKVEEKLKKAVEKFNRTSGRPYQISFSMGHALFDQKDEDSFLEAIDSAMYKDKQARHVSGELRERRRNR